MSYEARRMLPPGGSRKRKEREESLYSAKPSPAPEKVMSNKVLAGYLAHEYLTKGTLLGKKFDPRRVMALSLSLSVSGDRRKSTKHKEDEPEPETEVKAEPECYAEVSNVVKSEGTHLPGIVNPTQLARWIQM